MKKTTAQDNETRTILITKTDGEEIQVDIPANWKITFGPAVANAGKARMEGATTGYRMMPMALRLYESEKMQRAIFTDVASFRDLSIPMRVKKTRVQEKDGFMECEGVRKRTTFQAKTHEWVDADVEAKQNPPLLDMPDDEEVFGKKK